MSKTRREFTPEFKQEAAALLRSSGRPLTQVAGELVIQPSMLCSWRRRQNGEVPRSQPVTAGTGRSRQCLFRYPRKRIRRPRSRACGVSWSVNALSVAFKKSHLHLPGAPEMSFRAITAHADTWPIRTACRVLGVSSSGYYAWRTRPDSARALANQQILADIRRLHASHHSRYGRPRLQAACRAEGRQTQPRRGRAADAGSRDASDCWPTLPSSDNQQPLCLPGRPEPAEPAVRGHAPNTVWLADITYLRTDKG
jgi:transposase-like protein